MPDTWTKDEVLEKAARVRDNLRAQFMEEGSLRPITFLYATRNPETGEEVKGFVLMPVIGDFGPDDKVFYAAAQRMVSEKCGAVGVVFASEIWTIDPAYQERIGFEAAFQEAKRWQGDLSKHPHSIEGVYVSVEHHRLSGGLTWIAQITRDAEGKPTLGEWVEQSWDGGSRAGRFAHILPPVN